MSYYFAKTLSGSFEDAVARATDALTAEGFGVITTIDLKETFKRKLDADFRPYTILGACNPKLALAALDVEDKVGTMLPCNVIVQEVGPGQVEVAAIDPVASMQGIGNPRLTEKAEAVGSMLQRVIARL
jgi:uncharacterized protein (DUF302 family)